MDDGAVEITHEQKVAAAADNNEWLVRNSLIINELRDVVFVYRHIEIATADVEPEGVVWF
jgi:hypothetical protein